MSHSWRDDRRPAAPETTRIVGLGASAGGLGVLEQFLSHVPVGSGMAYVVVQHMDPTHKPMLAPLLQRVTAMPVREATQSMRVEPDAVYVIAPNTEITAVGGLLHLAEPLQPRGMRLPIDVLFCSLARDQGERAIGVVLSGMGADGTVGLQAIKARGGLTLAQLPESAQFDSMPRNAIASGAVDIVALAAEMPQRILQAASLLGADSASSPDGEGSPAALAAILDLLNQRNRHDLASYKPSTLRRRIERRMGVHGLASMDQYEAFLRQNANEIDLLFKEMLIGVTSFFRDPAVWQDLKDKVLPELLARRSGGERLRAWVCGCSTGEEAYSLAMVFREVADSLPNPEAFALQIFATDLSADAVAIARRGCYPAKAMADVTPERIARFFQAEGDAFVVNKEIRQLVLFAQHDVILDPPFTKLDILSCRNLLIYFDAALQRRLLPLFHYSLRRGGSLLLGGSETVGRSHTLFDALEPKSRLYRRSDNGADTGAVDFPVQRRIATRARAQEYAVPHSPSSVANLQTLAEQVLLQSYSPPAVLVNAGGDIVYISGHTGRFLEPAAGKANWNIHVMARPAIRTQVAAALRQAAQDDKPVELRGLKLDDDARTLDVTVRALREPKALEGMLMLVFRDVAPVVKARRRPGGVVDAQTQDELLRCHEEIRLLRQEMRASAEELQAAIEELQSTNEELQSANEELTTSKEESQSMNEELQTINGELQSKLDDLALAQSDMANLLNSTDIATLFLDNAMNVRRFTERVTRIIHLREADVGRPLSDLTSILVYPHLSADAKETLRSLAVSEKQIATTDGHWFNVRIMPYRTLANLIQGVVITFVDITAAKELESQLRKA